MNLIIPKEVKLEVIQQVVDEFLIPHFLDLGMNASGNWINSLEVRDSGINSVEIWGADYIYYLVNGRANGNRPPIEPLKQWVSYKLGYNGAQGTSIAFAIANKIAKEGTEYYPQGTDLLEILTSQEVTTFINEKIGNFVVYNTRLEMLRMFKILE